jgi:thymidylate synthase (FAD)
MQVIKPSYEIVNEPDWDQVTMGLEKAIRVCYKSEKNITPDSANKLIRNIIERGHESTLEHHSMTIRFVCDRGVSHELVRHRLCSFSQESTRYVNYSPDGKNNEGDMQFILPCWMDDKYLGAWHTRWDNFIAEQDDYESGAVHWLSAMEGAQGLYNELIEKGWNPEHARSVLPNSLKTEIVMTTNMRDWRHIFMLRCDKTAHPQMRELMMPLWAELSTKCPTLFDSVEFEEEDYTVIKQRSTKTGTKKCGE